MAESEQKKPDTPQTPLQAGPETASPAKSADSKLDQDFAKKLEEREKVYRDKTQELEKQFYSKGSTGRAKYELIIERQKQRLRNKTEEHRAKFKELLADQKAQRMNLILGEAEQDYINIYFPFTKIIEYCRGLDTIDDAELARLEAIMEGMTKLRANPEAEKLFIKVISKQELKPEDYQKIASMINPFDVQKEISQKNTTKLFEAAQVGAIIGVMQPTQRLELVNTILKTKKPDQIQTTLELFLDSNILTIIQVQSLCEQNKVPEPAKTALLAKINSGEAANKQKEYKAKIETLATVNQGRTAENNALKMAGPPGLAMLGFLWSGAVMLVNAKANWNSKEIGQSLKNIATNPYVIGAAGLNFLSTSYIANTASPELGSKIPFNPFSQAAKAPEKLESNRQAFLQEMEAPLQNNPFFAKLLATEEKLPGQDKKTVFQVLIEMSREMAAKGKKADLKYSEVAARLGPAQKELLQKALGAEGSKPFLLEGKLNNFMASCFAEDITTAEKFKVYLDNFYKKQGIKVT